MEYTDEDLLRWASEGKGEHSDFLREMQKRYETNRLSFFLAHGAQKGFINHRGEPLIILWGSNQSGKTWVGLGRLGLQTIPCDRDWECFTPEHGILFPEWHGPQLCMLASYQMKDHCRKNLWPKLAMLLPEEELGVYSPHWKPRDSRIKRKEPNWNGSPEVRLRCGTEYHFYSYEQKSTVFESTSYHKGYFDEEVPEHIFDAAWTRSTTTSEIYEATITATPVVVAERPHDTGIRWWPVKMESGALNKAIKFKSFHLSRADVPTAIITKERQEADYRRWIIEPALARNSKKIREGKSRWYGVPESSEGMLYDFDPNIHFITPFKIPDYWTRCRAFDPGKKHNFAGLWAAISPHQDIVLYREYLERDLTTEENVKRIIGMSGNERSKIEGAAMRIEEGVEVPVYEEVFKKERYSFSVMDGRAFKAPTGDKCVTQGMVFQRLGLRCSPASTLKNEDASPIINEYFELCPEREHILVRLKIQKEVIDPATGKPFLGAPRLYVFSTLRMFRTQIEAYTDYDQDDEDEMNCLKYLLLARPRYLGPDELYPQRDEEPAGTGSHARMGTYVEA